MLTKQITVTFILSIIILFWPMKANQNLRVPFTLSPPTVKKSLRLSNPESQISSSVKRQLSPSNHSQNSDVKNKLQYFLKDDSVTPSRNENNQKKQINQLLQKVAKLQLSEKESKEVIIQMGKQSMQLMRMNEYLKESLFSNEVQKINQVKMEEEHLALQKSIDGLQREIKQKNNFINIQLIAKQHNSNLIQEMKFQIRQVHEMYNDEKMKSQSLFQKLMKSQQQQLNLKRKLRQYQKKGAQKSQRQSQQSVRVFERQNQNLKQKIRILTGINDRQKQQITQLMVALDSKPVSTLTQIKGQQSHSYQFDQDYSQIMQRCLTQDSEQLRSRVTELQHIISQLRQENKQLKSKVESLKRGGSSKQLQDLLLEKQQYESELKDQCRKIVSLNQKLYEFNHQINLLKDQREHHCEIIRQFQVINNKIEDQLKDTYEEKIKYMKQVSSLVETIKQLEQFKADYEILQQQCRVTKEQLKQMETQLEQMDRKNRQLLTFIQELRAAEQRLSDQLIDKNYQIQQLRHNKLKPNEQIIFPETEESNKLGRLMRQRNIIIMGSLNKFKQGVMDELRVMSVEMSMVMATHKSEQVQELCTKVRRRLDTILQTI